MKDIDMLNYDVITKIIRDSVNFKGEQNENNSNTI